MRRFIPTPNHFTLNQRVKARQWHKAEVQANAVPLPDELIGLSDDELKARGKVIIILDNGSRLLKLSTHKYE